MINSFSPFLMKNVSVQCATIYNCLICYELIYKEEKCTFDYNVQVRKSGVDKFDGFI